MDRRRYLAAAGAVAVAGCLGSNEDGEASGGDGGGTAYRQGDRQQMLLTEADFPSGWRRDEERDQNFDAVFRNPNSGVLVMNSVEIYESISEAQRNLSNAKVGLQQPQTLDIAEEAFGGKRGLAFIMFRDGNAVGQVAGLRSNGAPAWDATDRYARMAYTKWQQM